MMSNQGQKLSLAVLLACSTMLVKAETMENLTSTPNYYKHLEVSAAGGPNWFNTKDTNLIISSFETDDIRQDGVSNNGAWKVGGGYYLNTIPLTRPFLNQLLLELNVYQITGTLHGSEFQYGLAEFNNYTSRAPFTSTRLMFDAKPTVFSWQRFSTYFIGGMGIAWNKISYHETAAIGIPTNSTLSLSSHTTTKLSWDVGAGVNVKLMEHLNVTAEYIYAFLGKGTPANNPSNGVNLVASPLFSFQTQSLLFGISVTL